MILTEGIPRLVVSLVGPDRTSLERDWGRAQALADVVELRLDLWDEPDASWILARSERRPVIVTCRPVRQGGQWAGSESGRLDHLERAVRAGAEAVDLELDTWATACERDWMSAERLVSHHEFEPGAGDVEELLARLGAVGAEALKLAITPSDAENALALLERVSRLATPATLIGMGEAGQVTRALGARYGNRLIYAALDADSRVAPGQLAADRLRIDYRFAEQSSDQIEGWYAVVGNPVAQSRSPEIHNLALSEESLPFVYVPLRVIDFSRFIERLAAHPCRGLSVTLPHKRAALEASTAADSAAREIGAANTLTRRLDGSWEAINTDAPAVLASLGGPEQVSGREVLVLGAGGASRAAVWALRQAGAQVSVANRTASRAAALGEELGARALPSLDVEASDYDIVVNATSVGLAPDTEATPLPAGRFRPGQVVFDTIYTPRHTRLLRDAAAGGAQLVLGEEMFLHQARLQWERWMGRPAPLRTWRARLSAPRELS